jgi:elongation factor 2
VVVVDAVEGVMAQTETVARQALEERVKPVLFINKVDRLISELRLSPSEIRKRFAGIINDFNSIIEIYGEIDFRDLWKVDPSKGSVVFGSALHRWGFTLGIAEKKGIKFSDREIVEAYEKRNVAKLSRVVPLHTAILDMVVKNIPSPVESQKYRLPRIWKGKLDSRMGQAMLKCSDDGPLVICITAVKSFPKEGLVATGRLFSGSIKKGDQVYLVGAGKKHNVENVSVYMSAFREAVSEITAGNIAAVSGLDSAGIGETGVGAQLEDESVPFESLRNVSQPVMTVAIEPKDPNDLEQVLNAMSRLSLEDPNLKTSADRETGQYLISGMGELHLEVAVNSLKQYLGAVELKTSAPIASYRETIRKKGKLVVAKSSNKLNEFWVQVEPIDEKGVKMFEQASLSTEMLRPDAFDLQGKNVWAFDEELDVLTGSIGQDKLSRDVVASVVSGFHWACRTGPLCEQPLRELKVNLIDAKVDASSDNREPKEIMRAMSRAILGSFLTAHPMLLEPIYKVEITVPLQWLGKCTNIIVRNRGSIQSTVQKGALAVINGLVPVAETFGLSEELRSATSGRAFWQLIFDHWEKVPEKLATTTIQKLRKKRGLRTEVPSPGTFVEEIRY